MAYNEESKRRTMKYLEKLKEIRFRVKPEEYKVYEYAAKKSGYPSMRQFYIDAINEKVKKIDEQHKLKQKVKSKTGTQNEVKTN